MDPKGQFITVLFVPRRLPCYVKIPHFISRQNKKWLDSVVRTLNFQNFADYLPVLL